MTSAQSSRDRLAPVASAYEMHPNWLYATLRDLFGRTNFAGARVLDVGAGNGLYTCMIAALGAQEVVALEPELTGSQTAVTTILQHQIENLELSNVTFTPQSLQDFRGVQKSFDFVLMVAVINHLDEAHVQTLHVSPESRSEYRRLLLPVYDLLKPGGQLIALDAGRTHAFSPLVKIGLLNGHPVWQGIEWHKHQNPQVWRDLLEEVGFNRIDHHWAGFTHISFVRFLTKYFQPLTWLIRPFFIMRATR